MRPPGVGARLLVAVWSAALWTLAFWCAYLVLGLSWWAAAAAVTVCMAVDPGHRWWQRRRHRPR